MLTRMRFKNFKAWKDPGEIRLAPLTVLFGANSAGKTSIPQLLLLMKQTAESSDRQRALHLGDSRTLVDLGSYEDAVHRHRVSHPLEINVDWKPAGSVSIADPITETEYEGNALSFGVSVKAEGDAQPQVRKMEYRLSSEAGEVLSVGLEREGADGKYNLNATGYKLVRQPGRPWKLPPPLRFYGFPDEAIAYYQNTGFLRDLVLQLEQMLRSVFYVGPLREHPKRLYLWSGENPDHVGVRGDRAIEAVLAAGNRAFNLKKKERTRTLEELVAERLQSMGLIREFEVKPLGKNRKEYEVLVSVGADLPMVKLTDVGFGVSQVLPVIVECFYVPANSIVIFEQPEIHLHPKVQSDLADLFIDAIRAREDGTPRNCQFIIESHSEHFLRRLQRRVAEGDLAKEEVALYFVNSEDGAAHIEELQVDEYGNISNWPQDFFGDEMADLVARAEAQASRTHK